MGVEVDEEKGKRRPWVAGFVVDVVFDIVDVEFALGGVKMTVHNIEYGLIEEFLQKLCYTAALGANFCSEERIGVLEHF